MIINKFSPATLTHLGHYVYALADPKNGKIFYIGKGSNDRVFDHAKAALTTTDSSFKLNTIRQIIARGDEVLILILRHGLKEKEALVVESVLIDVFTNQSIKNLKIGAGLSNRQAGHDMRELGIRTADELEAQYGNTPLGAVKDKLIVININKTYHSGISIYDATRMSWVLKKQRADKVNYILSEYNGVIRAVFVFKDPKIGWQPFHNPQDKRQRYYFEGYEITDPAILSQYMNKRINKKRGASNPIRYFNV